jgi:membrane-associated protease RseP (regulator of RpoE activity)
LFLLTLVTTTIFGSVLDQCFVSNSPLTTEHLFEGYRRLMHGNRSLLVGLEFSIPLLLILLVHEFGHYFACQRWRVEASLPYFIPSPLLIGTCGAFIRIRSPIYTRKSLFDIGISGPLAGFLVLIPFLVAGILLSKITPGIGGQGEFTFGTPLLMRAAEWLRFPGVSVDDISLHPVARAAWAGLIATAINLLPIGQLDGGHIVYALFGEWHRSLSRLFTVALLPLGFFFSWGWLLYAVILLFLRIRHPFIYDQTPLDKARVRLGAAALFLFLLSFSPSPVRPH